MLNEEQLKILEEMAAALMLPEEIAILLKIQYEDRKLFAHKCKSHQSSPEYEAYQRGKLTTKLELRRTVVKLAKAGSPAAEPLADKFIREQNLKE